MVITKQSQRTEQKHKVELGTTIHSGEFSLLITKACWLWTSGNNLWRQKTKIYSTSCTWQSCAHKIVLIHKRERYWKALSEVQNSTRFNFIRKLLYKSLSFLWMSFSQNIRFEHPSNLYFLSTLLVLLCLKTLRHCVWVSRKKRQKRYRDIELQ